MLGSVHADVLPQDFEYQRRQNGITILAALALSNMDSLSTGIDVLHAQPRDLTYPEPGRIENEGDGPVLG